MTDKYKPELTNEAPMSTLLNTEQLARKRVRPYLHLKLR